MLFGVRASWIVMWQQAQTAKRPEKNKTPQLISWPTITHRWSSISARLDVNAWRSRLCKALPYYRWCSKGWGDVMPLWSFSLLHFDSPLFSMHFGENTLPFSTRFHPFCRKYCKSPKWKPLNSSSLRLTRIDVIASLGLPWKHRAPKNSNTLIQPAPGLAWRGWLYINP